MNIFESIGYKNLIIYFVIVNVIAFFMFFLDKRYAQKGKWRIPEKSLLLAALLGGGIGSLCGMYTFRHKTKKLRFSIGVPVILISEIAILIYLWYNSIG